MERARDFPRQSVAKLEFSNIILRAVALMQDRYTGFPTQTLWRMEVLPLMSHLPHVQKSVAENLLPKTFNVNPQKPLQFL